MLNTAAEVRQTLMDVETHVAMVMDAVRLWNKINVWGAMTGKDAVYPHRGSLNAVAAFDACLGIPLTYGAFYAATILDLFLKNAALRRLSPPPADDSWFTHEAFELATGIRLDSVPGWAVAKNAYDAREHMHGVTSYLLSGDVLHSWFVACADVAAAVEAALGGPGTCECLPPPSPNGRNA